MPFNPDTSLLDSPFLCEFLADCDLPATVQITEGYDSNESEEQSWCQGEIVNMHAMKDIPQVLALDRKGNRFRIPLNYTEKIFESIPNRCSDEYGTVEQLIVDFPKYVRSLGNITQSGVKVGDILCLQETSVNAAGCTELKCKVARTSRSITLTGDQVGPFETLEDVDPTTIRDITDRHLLPTRMRVRGEILVFNETNGNEKVIFKGLFTLKEIVKEKVLIVSTLTGKDLRVVKLPIDLEIRVKREDLKLDPKLFAEICQLIDREVNIESTIMSGNGEASWMFDIGYIERRDIEAQQADDVYEELAPLVPPRSPSNLKESNSKQNTIVNTADSETRYAPSPKPKSPRSSESLASSKDHKGIGKPAPPPVSKKPNVQKHNKPFANTTNITSQNIDSFNETKRSDVTSHHNRPDEAEERPGCIGDTQPVSPSKPKPASKPKKPGVAKGSPKPVPLELSKSKLNTISPKSREGKQPSSSNPCIALQDSSSLKTHESEGSPTKPVGAQNIESHTKSKLPIVKYNRSRSDETEENYEYISNIQPISSQKANPATNPVSSAVPLPIVKDNRSRPDETEEDYEYISNIQPVSPQKANPETNPVRLAVPLGNLTPNVIKQKPVEEPLPRSQRSASPLQNSSSSKCESKDSPTELTLQNPKLIREAEMSAKRTNGKRRDNAEDDAGKAPSKAKELLKDISVSEVSGWLTKLGLSEYVDRFVEESIDGNFLLELDTEMMQYLGISNPLHKKKLMMFIQKGWTPKK